MKLSNLLLLFVFVQGLFVSSLAATSNLTPGSPQRDTAAKGQFEKFKFPKQSLDDTTTLYFVITPFSGDADLYINYDSYPSLDNHLWNSTSTYDDKVIIEKDDPKYKPDKEYYIGIYGHSHADFGIVGYTTNHSISITYQGLTDSSAAISAATVQNDYAFFEYDPSGDDSNFTVSVTPIEGDPDIFISTKTSNPTRDNHEWAARDFGFDLIQLSPSDGNTKYYIGVYGYGKDTLFSILVSQANTRRIIPDGVPMADIVEEGEYIYYDFQLYNPSGASEQRGLFIELKTLGINSEGDPDLYVTVGDDNKNPTKNKNTWSSSGFFQDFISIKTDDKNFKPNSEYHIGVHGFRKATYQLTVYTEGDSVILQTGVPTSGEVDNHEYKYFKFKHEDTEAGLLFRTFANQGAVSTYVSEAVTKPKKEDHKHDFESSTSHQEESVIYISPDDNHFHWYWLSVYGEQRYNNFTLTAATNQSSELLEEGKTSLWHSVPQDHYRYFIFNDYSKEKDITVVVDTIVGDTDLYISNTLERPSNTHYTWKATSDGTDTVNISPDDPNWKSGRDQLYIAVHGWTQSIFNILVFESDKPQILYENLPTPGFVSEGNYNFYKVETPKQGGSVSFHIDLKLKSQNMDADIYASHKTEKPTKHDYKYKANKFGGDFLRIDRATPGTWYIGVRGVTNSSYSITMATEMVELISTESLLDSATDSHSRNYSFQVGSQAEAVLATVTLVDGATELYMNIDSKENPTRRHHNVSDISFPGNAILLTKANNGEIFKPGEWRMTVNATRQSTYFISYMETAGMLKPGVPRLGMTNPAYHPLYLHYINAYNTSTHDVADDYYLFVDTLSGEFEVYVSQENVIPGPANHTWVSKSPGDHMLVMSKNKLKPGNLRISIRPSSRLVGSGDFKFSITIGKKNDPIFLTSTIPQEKVTLPNEHSYFSVLTPEYQKQNGHHNVTKKLEVTVESCTPQAAPAFYIGGPNNKYPSKDTNQAASNAQDTSFTQYAGIENTPSGQTYHIGVDGGPKGSTYAIFATSGVNERPIVKGGDLSGSYDEDSSVLTLKLHDASSTNFPHAYFGYYMAYDEDQHGNGSTVNFDTFCAIETLGIHAGTHYINGPQDDGADSDFKMDLTDLNKDEIYAINVVVESGWSSTNKNPGGEGLKTAYHKKWLVHGELKDSPLYDSGGGYHFKVGWFLVGMSLGLFTLYFVVGMIVKAVRGARGVDIIPNVEFWKDLPFMVKDGAVFVFTCGRGSIGGSSRYEDLDRSSSTNGNEQAAGYGSI